MIEYKYLALFVCILLSLIISVLVAYSAVYFYDLKMKDTVNYLVDVTIFLVTFVFTLGASFSLLALLAFAILKATGLILN